MFYSHNSRELWIDAAIILSFLLLVLLFFFRFLDGREIFAFKDLSRYFYPLRFLMAEQVKAGYLPLWNPYIFCGFPMMASLQVGFFYPLTIIYYLLPFNLAFNYYMILHYFLAACFMYALLRHYQLSRSAAYFGGIVFAFSGYLLSVSNMNTSLSSVIWLPLILIFYNKLINKTEPFSKEFIILCFLFALMFLGGEPTIFYVTIWFLIFYTLVFSVKRMQNLGMLILMALISLGIIAVQLVPFIELIKLSDRVVRTQYELVSFSSFPPREVLNFIFPFFFGNPSKFGNYTVALLGETYQGWLISPYFGILPLVFIFFSFRDKKRSIFLAIAAVVALFLAFGRYTPLYRFLYQFIPGISMIRYPVKYLFLVTFCASMLSAIGFDNLLSKISGNKERLKKIVFFLGPLVISLLILFIAGYFYAQKIYDFLAQKYAHNIPTYFFELLARIIQFDLQSLFNIIAYLLILALIVWLSYRSRISKNVFTGAVLLVTIADLFSVGSSITVGAAARVFAKTPENYSILQKDKGLYRFFYTPEVEKQNQFIYGDTYLDALWNVKDNFAANWHIPYHFYDFYGYESIHPWALNEFSRKHFSSQNIKHNLKYLDKFNVKYVISQEPLAFPWLKLLRHKHKYAVDIYLYENERVLPRAYLLNQGRVSIESYRPGEIKIKVMARSPDALFLSEAYYPGWKAYVDGKEQTIARAEELFCQIPIAAGRHEVEFVYDPLSFKVGAGISIFSLLLSAFCFLKWGGRPDLNRQPSDPQSDALTN